MREHHRCVYKITNTVTGFTYIGSTVDPGVRWKHHQANIKNRKYGNPLMYADYCKHGIDSFSFCIIQSFDTTKEMWDLENRLIKEQMKNGHCYNIKTGA
jgi:group I intron endonuclease